MSCSRCCGMVATMSLRITVCTSAPAPAASSSSPAHGTVSPASTTDAPWYSTRNPMVGATGRWSVGATRIDTPSRSHTGPSVCSRTSTAGAR